MKRVFFDTSALMKRYLRHEKGTEQVEIILETTEEIIVAPTYYIEAVHVVGRLSREKKISTTQIGEITKEIGLDYEDFHISIYDNSLIAIAAEYAATLGVKTLDAIQLASAKVSKTKCFVTADKPLYNHAKKIKNWSAIFIGV